MYLCTIKSKTIKNIRDNPFKTDRYRVVGVALVAVAMVVYAFDADTYDIKEVGGYDEATCEVLSKHDTDHVKRYEFPDIDPDNSWKVYAEMNIKYKKVVYNRSFKK